MPPLNTNLHRHSTVSNPSPTSPILRRHPTLPEKSKPENTHRPRQSQHRSPSPFTKATAPLNRQLPNPQSKNMRWPGACQVAVAAGVMDRLMSGSEAGSIRHVVTPPRFLNGRISCHFPWSLAQRVLDSNPIAPPNTQIIWHGISTPQLLYIFRCFLRFRRFRCKCRFTFASAR